MRFSSSICIKARNIIGFFVLASAIVSAYFLKGSDKDSQFLFLWLLSIAIFSDTGGYIFGKKIGGKKLTKISPNKTISGTIGSFIFSTFPIFIIYFLENLSSFTFGYLSLSVKNLILSLILSFLLFYSITLIQVTEF